MPVKWSQLVKQAKDSDRDFEALMSKIKPTFLVVAGHLSSDISELVQVAQIAVWNVLSKVKLNKPETIKGFLLVVGVNAMKGVVRNERRKKRISCDDIDESVFAVNISADVNFEGLLQEYEKYIQRNGKFQGAHREMAKRKGISKWSMRREFHQAAKLFLEELNR